jgi:hypothetical protein
MITLKLKLNQKYFYRFNWSVMINLIVVKRIKINNLIIMRKNFH